MHLAVRALILPSVTVAVSVALQEPAPRKLGQPTATFGGELSAIGGVRELADGRVLLTDPLEPSIRLVDLKSRSATTIGRAGSGPSEFRGPGGVYGLGDSMLVVDRQQSRALVIDAAGRLVGTKSLARGGFTSATDANYDQVQFDGAGRLYEVAFNPMDRTDSVTLVRWDASLSRRDTLARLGRPPRKVVSSTSNSLVTRAAIFGAADAWSVAPDGRVAVVRANPYRVEWVHPDGRVVVGQAIPTDEIPVTDADKVVATTETPAGSISTSGRSRQPTSAPPLAPGDRIYAATKPPFATDGVKIWSDGRVWVRRHVPARSTLVIYDVFGSNGTRVDRIQFPARHRVVGIGKGSVYAEVLDKDDLPVLTRYSLGR